jgi:UbiA prenyltransferase family
VAVLRSFREKNEEVRYNVTPKTSIPRDVKRLPAVSIAFAWLQLVRFPNAFTVVADVMAGAMLARGTWSPWPLIAVLVVAAVGIYWAGMILNDVYDIEKDRIQNRGRPLVDGRISRSSARRVGYLLLVGGVVSVLIATMAFAKLLPSDTFREPSSWLVYSTPLVTVLLGLSVWLYDGPLKATQIGPVLMGLCRVGSLLLGISIGWWLTPTQPWNAPHLWMAAIGHGVYVMGITWAARREAEANQTWTLAFGWCVCLVGIAMLASVSWFVSEDVHLRLTAETSYPMAIGLLALPWARRAVFSVVSPSSGTIQAAVKQAILSIIFFDSILALQFGGPWPAIAICSLIIPAMILGRYFRST